MTVQCPGCRTRFPVDARKVPPQGVHARCSVCEEVFFVEPAYGMSGAPLLRKEEMRPEEVVAGAQDALSAQGPAEMEQPVGFAAAEVGDTVDRSGMGEPLEAEGDKAVGPAVAEEVPWEEESGWAQPPADAGWAVPEGVDVAGTALEEPWVEKEEGAGEAASLTGGEEFVMEPFYSVEAGAPRGTLTEDLPEYEQASTPAPTHELPGGLSHPSAAETVSGPTALPPAPGPFVSPPQFGRRDPRERAQRLARVLISDIVLYHPERHRRALTEGRVAVEFQEEIRKSWEEYLDQVGPGLADSTTYFTDALNEILAKGQSLFSPGSLGR